MNCPKCQEDMMSMSTHYCSPAKEKPLCPSDATDCSPVGWKSIAWWPDTVSLLNEENTSEDKHHSEEAADAVCRALRREGLGGGRKANLPTPNESGTNLSGERLALP